MASDEEYMNFLDKANKDPAEGLVNQRGLSNGRHEFKATDAGAQIPQPLVQATTDAFYTSDGDEPFVPVYLSWDEAGKGLPDEGEWPPQPEVHGSPPRREGGCRC
jgi:hypothetical protein